jgi:hypothetical protein
MNKRLKRIATDKASSNPARTSRKLFRLEVFDDVLGELVGRQSLWQFCHSQQISWIVGKAKLVCLKFDVRYSAAGSCLGA